MTAPPEPPDADLAWPSPPARRQRRRGALAWLAVIPLGLLAVVLAGYAFQTTPSAPPDRRTVVASLPYWNLAAGTADVLAHRSAVNEVSPWMYGLGADGQVQLDAGLNRATVASSLTQLRASGLPLVPTLANINHQGSWSYPNVSRVLHDPATTRRNIAAITALVVRQHYAGIDIDYENLHAADRAAFTSFVTRLAAALHARGKILSVALFAKASNAGYAPRNVAQDYAALGRVADQVRLMGYDYHWATSPPGPVAPAGWIRQVLAYAKTQIPAAKIILGLPQYGYDWSGGYGRSITWAQAVQLARQPSARRHYSRSAQAPWFTYTARSGRRHTVWFEDAESTRAKLALAQGSGIGGVYLWMYGNGDPATWPALRRALPLRGTSPAARTKS